MIKVIQMYLKMIKTGLNLLLWPLFTHKYILVNKKVAAVHHFVYILNFRQLNLLPSGIIMFHMLSELPPLS